MGGELGELRHWSGPAAAVLIGLGLGLVARRFLLPLLAKAAARTTWRYDDLVIDAIKGPVVIWGLLIGIRVSIRMLGVAPETERLLAKATVVLGILSVTWAAGRFAGSLTRQFAARGTLPGVSLLGNITRIIVFVIGFLILLQTLGIAITPMLTALGVGGLAVGLALQDTLANLFAGIRILAGGRLRHGDFVKLESGEEGWIEDIAWGTTTVRQGLGNLVIVPNAKLGQAITANYDLPSLPQIVIVNLGVAYGSDLEQVERVTLEEAVAAQQASRVGVKDHTPVLRYTAFGDFSINFLVVLRSLNYPDRGELVHDFLKRIARRYQAESIEIPFPTRRIITTASDPDSPPSSRQ